MKRQIATLQVENINTLKLQMLCWANQFNICCLLDNNNYKYAYNTFEILLAVGEKKIFTSTSNTSEISSLYDFLAFNNDWLFGHISYDFKNNIYPFQSFKEDKTQFPDVFLFQPEIVLKLVGNSLTIESLSTNPSTIFNTISAIQTINKIIDNNAPIKVTARLEKQTYINTVNQLKKHIQNGDCYEINFCQEFFAENTDLNPLEVYTKLNSISPTPFGAYYKINDKYLLCASPERFIKKVGGNIISQPIKGTAKRNLINNHKDELLKQSLLQSQKEKSENVMIVDLVRNDLSKIANTNSVSVEELFGLYTFPQVHQIISTISAKIDVNINFANVLKALFPMGSMTGAPKFKVMQLIEKYEQTKRGIYSGCIGYITPKNDFDFNVVIRSIVYNKTNKFINYMVGSAITHYSIPQDEYEECLLKAKAMESALQ